MQRYNMFQAFVLSFFSKELYRDVAFNWGGKTFLYLFFLVVLSWITSTIQTQSVLNVAVKAHADEYIQQVPILTFKEGKLSTPENRPYIIKNTKTSETIGVIDTSGQFKTLEAAHANMLLTQTDFITRSDKDQTKITPIPKNISAVVDPQVVGKQIKHYVSYLWIPIFIMLVVVGYLYRIIQSLIYALIGKIFAGRGVHYSQILQIAMVAITPALVLSTVFDAFLIRFPFQLLLYFVITLFYLFFGISACKTQPVATDYTNKNPDA